MKKQALRSIIVASAFMVANDAFPCTVQEVADMIQGKAGNSVITENCPGRLDDAPRCTLRQVLADLRRGKDEDDVVKQCSECKRPTCLTNRGRCPITMANDRPYEDGECSCFTQFGALEGITECH